MYENTSLTLVGPDNRRINTLEIVIPVLNEKDRISGIANAYADLASIVLLDGGSNNESIKIYLDLGCTVFRREPPETQGENHFIRYLDEYSVSGKALYMFADECITRTHLQITNIILNDYDVIYYHRIDWLYGYSSSQPQCKIPKAFKRKSIEYQKSLHDSIKIKNTSKVAPNVLEVQHMQTTDQISDYGKVGSYISTEIKLARMEKTKIKFSYFLFRRFIVSEILLAPKKIYRYRKSGLLLACVYSFHCIITVFVAALSVICNKFLLSQQEQQKIYRQAFDEISKK